ncbi:1257_t:CDS:1, partial [Funneliformis caledonium]
ENMGFWKNGCFNDYISSELECDNSDKDYMLFENDDYSITTDNTSEIPSIPVTTINDDNCIYEFLFDYEALQNANEKLV